MGHVADTGECLSFAQQHAEIGHTNDSSEHGVG